MTEVLFNGVTGLGFGLPSGRHAASGEHVEQLRAIPLREENSLLTKRELEIARLATEGFSNQAIAETLHIEDSTVKKHLANIFQKTGVKNRSGLHKIFV